MATRNVLSDLFDGDTSEEDKIAERVSRGMARRNLARVKLGVKIRDEVAAMFAKQRQLGRVCQVLHRNSKQDGILTHVHMKSAVDAIYYFGGGWPRENSKGRMERTLDEVAGMYRVLHFIGEGEMVETHLAKKGIKISLPRAAQIKDFKLNDATRSWLRHYGIDSATCETFRDVVHQVLMMNHALQAEICKKADVVRHSIKPKLSEELGLDSPEFNRAMDIVKTKMKGERKGDKRVENIIPAKIKDVDTSIVAYHSLVDEIPKKNVRDLPEVPA